MMDGSTLDYGNWIRQNRSRRVSLSGIITSVATIDFALCLLAGWLALVLQPAGGPPGWACLVSAAAGGLTVCVMLQAMRAYQFIGLTDVSVQAVSLCPGLLTGAAVFAGSMAMLQGETRIDWVLVAQWTVFAAVLFAGGRAALAIVLASFRRSGLLVQRIALVGSQQGVEAFLTHAVFGPELPTHIVGVFSEELQPRACGSLDDLLAESRRELVDVVIVAVPPHDRARLPAIMQRLGSMVTDIYQFSGHYDSAGPARETVAGLPVLPLARRPLGTWQAFRKEMFDRAGSLMLILLLLPLLCLVALLIKVDSRGPVLFRQARTGFNNTTFTCFKFRTMYCHMTDPLGNRQTMRGDPRVTRVGRWLRRLSIDELPQLFNVLIGNMSLVGPRPHPLATRLQDRAFSEVVPEYEQRHCVKPGITGWAQVNGWRGEVVTAEHIRGRVAYDLYYIANWSLLLDLRILLMTLTREIISIRAY